MQQLRQAERKRAAPSPKATQRAALREGPGRVTQARRPASVHLPTSEQFTGRLGFPFSRPTWKSQVPSRSSKVQLAGVSPKHGRNWPAKASSKSKPGEPGQQAQSAMAAGPRATGTTERERRGRRRDRLCCCCCPRLLLAWLQSAGRRNLNGLRWTRPPLRVTCGKGRRQPRLVLAPLQCVLGQLLLLLCSRPALPPPLPPRGGSLRLRWLQRSSSPLRVHSCPSQCPRQSPKGRARLVAPGQEAWEEQQSSKVKSRPKSIDAFLRVLSRLEIHPWKGPQGGLLYHSIICRNI